MAQYRANQQQEIETGPVPLSEEFASIHPALTEAVMTTSSIDPGNVDYYEVLKLSTLRDFKYKKALCYKMNWCASIKIIGFLL